jgi:chromosome segregation ATPase
MDNGSQIAINIKAVQELAARCAATENSENYGILDAQVETLEEQAREAVQSQLAISLLLAKLKERKPLEAEDLKTLELLIVGDAESFLKYEADLDGWKNEVGQLMAEIGKLQASQLDVDGLMHLRALCQELRRVLPNIVYYLDQKERTAKFQEATKGPLDAEGYRALSEIIDAMASSEKM